MGTSTDILEQYSSQFADILRNINRELSTIEKQLGEQELREAVSSELNALIDKYSDKIDFPGSQAEIKGKLKEKIREKFEPHLIAKRTASLKDAMDKLVKLRAEVLSVAPASSYKQAAQIPTEVACAQ